MIDNSIRREFNNNVSAYVTERRNAMLREAQFAHDSDYQQEQKTFEEQDAMLAKQDEALQIAYLKAEYPKDEAKMAEVTQQLSNVRAQRAQLKTEHTAKLKAIDAEFKKHKSFAKDPKNFKKDFDYDTYKKEQEEKQKAQEQYDKKNVSSDNAANTAKSEPSKDTKATSDMPTEKAPQDDTDKTATDKDDSEAQEEKKSSQSNLDDETAHPLRSSTAVNSLANYFSSKALGGAPLEPNSHRFRNQADMHEKQAGDEQKNAQQNFQIANRNYRVEAEKNAAAQAASKNEQRIQNQHGAQATLARQVEDADYNTHMNRQDAQRKEGIANQREMWGARQTAEQERASADKADFDYRDHLLYNNNADSLSRGGYPDDGRSSVTSNVTEDNTPPQETTSQEQPKEQQDNQPRIGKWTYYDVQQAVNMVCEKTGAQGMTPQITDQRIRERSNADPKDERARLAPLVQEMENGAYNKYVEWLKSKNVRNGNVSIAKSTALQKDHGNMVKQDSSIVNAVTANKYQ